MFSQDSLVLNRFLRMTSSGLANLASKNWSTPCLFGKIKDVGRSNEIRHRDLLDLIESVNEGLVSTFRYYFRFMASVLLLHVKILRGDIDNMPGN
jgi:hypothetical protein